MVKYFRERGPTYGYSTGKPVTPMYYHIVDPTYKNPLDDGYEKPYQVGSVRVDVSAPKEINYWDDKKSHGYSNEYLKHLSENHPLDSVRSAAYHLSRVDTMPERYKHDKDLVDYAKDIVDNVPRETLWEMKPGEVAVHSAFSAPGYGPHMSTLMALIHRDHPDHDIVPSDDLSVHSARLANHAAVLGLPIKPHEGNPDLEPVNDISFADSRATPVTDNHIRDLQELNLEVPKAEIDDARQFVRNKLSSTQFAQSRAAEKKRNREEHENSKEYRHARGIYMLPGFGDED